MTRGVGVLLFVAWASGCANGGGPPAAQPAAAASAVLPPVTHARVADANAEHARAFMSALVSGSTEAAEADFDDTMRSKLPPPLLRSLWLSMQAKYGAVSSWKLTRRDALSGKDRFTFAVQFPARSIDTLVVFEPSGQLIGLFFPNLRPDAPSSEPADPRVRQSSIAVGPLRLPGNLTLPAATSVALIPGVVLVPGSGPNDRDETVQQAKPFRDLAFGLAARGIAAVRFDKRTHARLDAVDLNTLTVEGEVVADAVAALTALRQRPEIDPQRVFVVGHSLGALLAPEIARRAGQIAGLVLLGAPGRSALVISIEQLRARGSMPEADLAAVEAQVHALPHLPPTELVLGIPASYWQDLDARDELGIAVKLGRPVLLLRGDADQNVAAVDQDHWLHGLQGKVPVEAATLPGLNHLFLAPDWQSSPHPHIPEAVLTRIAAFIRGTAIAPQH